MTVSVELKEKFENMTNSIERYEEIQKHLPMLKLATLSRTVVDNVCGIKGNRFRFVVKISNGKKGVTFVYNDSINNYKQRQHKLNRMDALHSYVLGAQCYEDSRNLEDFANNLGYNMEDEEGQKQAVKAYNGCRVAYDNLNSLFNSDELELLKVATSNY